MKCDDILKALECCGSEDEESCLKCPLVDEPGINCFRVLCTESVKLMKSQKEELERLNKRVTDLDLTELFDPNNY